MSSVSSSDLYPLAGISILSFVSKAVDRGEEWRDRRTDGETFVYPFSQCVMFGACRHVSGLQPVPRADSG